MTTTETDANITDETPTWSTAEEMFPVPDGATTEEINAILAKREEYNALLQQNADLAAGNDRLDAAITEQRERHVRNLARFDVALTVAQQLVPIVGETDVVVKRPRGEVEVSLELDTCTFTVRVENGVAYLDMASKKPGINPITLTIDADGLSAANALSIPFYTMLDTKAPLPKRAHEELIKPNPLAKLMERMSNADGAPGLGGLFATIFGEADDDMSSLPPEIREHVESCNEPMCGVRMMLGL